MGGIIGWTTKLEYSGVPATTYTAISETVMIQAPGQEVSKIETTHLGVVNGVRTYSPGLKDPSSVSIETNYSKATRALVETLIGVAKTWKITAPDEDGAGVDTSPTHTFVGFISKVDPVDFKPDEIVKLKFDLQISGAVAIA